MKLSETALSETDERLLNILNNAITFIFDINNYAASVCACVEVFSILRYKINNIRPALNKLMLIIIKLRNVHKGEESRICLKY